jgi:hypothetical protein
MEAAMRKTTLRVPVPGQAEPAVITLSFRDDPAELSPTTAAVAYARPRMPAEMPVYRPRGENPAVDSAQDRWGEQEELVRRGVLAEFTGYVRGCCDPAPPDITWTSAGWRLVADCTLTRDGRPVDVAISEPVR